MWKTLTFALILVNVIFFMIEPKDQFGEVDLNDPFNQNLYFTPDHALQMPWTFVSSMFMHADLEHIFFNMFALFIFGLFLENRVRPTTFLLVYFLAGIVGNFGYMLTTYAGFFPGLTPGTPGLGASGAIYGVMGALGVIAPRASIYIMLIPIPIPMFVAVIIYAIIEVLGLFAPGTIARGAHIGGLAVGVLAGFVLRYQANRTRDKVSYIWEH